MAALAARIARALRLPDEDVRFVHYAALVHCQASIEVPGLAPLGDALRHVNEHFDGTGGPDGLVGAQIPLVSRIVRVAVEHAQRPGDDPLAVLQLHAGTRLDPCVVEALEQVLHAHVAVT